MRVLVGVLLVLSLVACGKKGEQVQDQEKGPVTNSAVTLRQIDTAELAKNDGKEGRPAWVAYKGKVYDVTAVPAWKTGTHKGHGAGQDITAAIASAPHGDKVFAKLTPVGELRK